MARKNMRRTYKPATFFTTEAELDEAYTLARRNLSIKSIADHFGCSYQCISTNQVVMPIIKEGWSHFAYEIEDELHSISMIKLREVPNEDRATYAKMKMTALSAIHKALHKDPFIAPIEVERVKRLTDEELQSELERVVSNGMAGRKGSDT